MSRLDEMIREMCPDGVEYIPLGQVAHYARNKIEASQVNEQSYVGVENLLQNKRGKTDASAVPTNGAVIAFEVGDILIGNIRPYLRKIWLADCVGGTNGDVLAVQIENKETLMPKFLYYVLSSEDFFLYDIQNSKGAKMPRGSKEAVLNYQIPVPPLEIQREIVRILDNFTELTAELTEKLAAELIARKKQYEFYRDKLLTFGVHGGASDVVWRTLGEMFPFIRNGFVGTVTPYYTNKESGIRYLQGTNVHNGCITDNDVFYVSMEFHKKHIRNELKSDDILVVQSGHVGECAVVGEKYRGANCHAMIIMSNGGECNSKYVSYYLQSHHGKQLLKKITTGGTLKHILASQIKNIVIPLPPIEEQNRIVSILDRFDVLCNDISEGIPAEIEARQKQYEYYRDKLLTFKTQ